MVPLLWRAKSQLKMKVRALPTWRKPVGEGAKRTRGVLAEEGAESGIVILCYQSRHNPTQNHPNGEDLSLGAPMPQKQKRGEGGAPVNFATREKTQAWGGYGGCGG
jgi:hypothetical protein